MLGETVTRLREQKGMTKAALSRLVGVSWVAIHHIEQGGGAKVSTLEKLAVALDCTVSDLFRESRRRKRKAG